MLVGIYDDGGLLSLSALTPLHIGVGRAGGAVDLPVQRDSFGYPVVFASSLKGALKTHAYHNGSNLMRCLFGPEPGDDEKYSSPVSLTDARLLFMPIRAAKANPVLVTSPKMIRDALDLLNLTTYLREGGRDGLEKIRKALQSLEGVDPRPGDAYLLGEEPKVNLGGKEEVIIGGDRFVARDASGVRAEDLGILKDLIIPAFKPLVPGRIVVLNDDDALRIVNKGIMRIARIRVNRDRKVVEKGGLWTEEHLPVGTTFISGVLTSRKRYRNTKCQGNMSNSEPANLLGKLSKALNLVNDEGYLVIGGKESVGRGIVRIKLLR